MPCVRRPAALALMWLALGCARVPEPRQRVTSAVTSAPFIGPESPIDSPAYTDREGDQRSPCIAPGGPGALVAWVDESLGQGLGGDKRVFAARVDADGAPLDRLPLPVAPKRPSPPAAVETPAAAWNGDVALVAWFELTGDGTEVHAGRVGRDGARMDVDGIDVALGPVSRNFLNVLPADGGFVVIWLDGATTVRFARVATNGTVTPLGGTAISLPASLSGTVLGGVARVDGGYLLLFGLLGLEVMKVDASGSVLAPLGPRGDGGNSPGPFLSLTSNGTTTALALWSESSSATSTPPWTLFGRRVSAAGAWIDAAPFVVRTAGPGEVGLVGAVWTGASFLCYWNEYLTRVSLAMRRFGADGAALDAAPLTAANLASVPLWSTQLAWTGARPVVSMVGVRNIIEGGSSQKDWPDGVRTRALDANLQPTGADAVLISVAPSSQVAPRAVGSPGAAYVVWQDDCNNSARTKWGLENMDAYGARVTVADGKLTQAVVPVVATSDSDLAPGVGWDGTQFSVTARVWDGAYAPKGTLVHVPAAGGSPGTAVSLTPPAEGSLLIWNGINYLLVEVGSGTAIVRRMTPSGGILDAALHVIGAPVTPGYQFADANGITGVGLAGAWVLLWGAAITDPDGGKPEVDQIEGEIIAADGTPAAPIVLSTGPSPRVTPAIATDGTDALVVWIDEGTADGGIGLSRLMGARFDGALARRDAADLVIAEAGAGATFGDPTVAWTGSAYVAVWTRTTGGVVSLASCLLGADLRCQPGSETSAVTGAAATVPRAADVGPLAIDTLFPVQGIADASLVWTDAGGVLFYRRHDMTANVDRDRLFARPIVIGAAPPPAFDAGVSADGGVFDATGGGGLGGAAGGGGGGGGSSAAGAGAGGSAAVSGAGGTGPAGGASGKGATKGGGCGCELTAMGERSEMLWGLAFGAMVLIVARFRSARA